MIMHIQTIIAGELQTNCYIVSHILSKECIIIDPGDGADTISEQILIQNLNPIAIIATHGHFDHILAAYELQTAFEIPFLIHEKDEFLLSKTTLSGEFWLKRKIWSRPPVADKFMKTGDIIKFGKHSLNVIHTPGHTPGGICLYNTKEKIIFTGDTLFKNGVGRTDLPYCSHEDLQKSLKKIRSRFAGYKAYPGHEGEFYV